MPLPRSVFDAAGMLLTAMSALGTVASRLNVALYAGSSHDGIKRRASEFSNWVYSARFLPTLVS